MDIFILESTKDINIIINDVKYPTLNEFKNEIFVKVRSTGKLLNAEVDFKDNDNTKVNLKNSEDGISPGQACVFYKKDNLGYKVLGGGWIKS